jgi:hypothetical protein
MAWLGPAIGPQQFEVGTEVREAFLARDDQSMAAFSERGRNFPGKYWANIFMLAHQRLAGMGVTRVFGGDLCTVSDPARFFSYRRDGRTGRMAAVIWLSG